MRATRKQSGRSRGQAEPPSPDLSIERHLSGGDRRSSSESSTAAARRRSRQGNREREEKTRVSEGEEATGQTDRAAGRARPVGLAPIGGPGPTGGPGLAEREVRGEVFNQNLKTEN
jgi:hypothetical protein